MATKMVQSAGQAVARIAYISSDVVLSVQPSLHQDSEFSATLRLLAGDATTSNIADRNPHIEVARTNNDPLLSTFTPLRKGKSVTVTASSDILLSAIPHLYKLARYPLVVHIALTPFGQPDFSVITSIRQSGFIFLQSETLQEAQDIAITAHALAAQTGVGVVHFFDPANSAQDKPIATEQTQLVKTLLDTRKLSLSAETSTDGNGVYADTRRQVTVMQEEQAGSQSPPATTNDTRSPALGGVAKPSASDEGSVSSSGRNSSTDSRPSASSASSAPSVKTRPLVSDDIYRILTSVWQKFEKLTARRYNAFEYSGPDNAEYAIFMFGSTGVFVDAILDPQATDDFKQCGIITARLYRPWLGTHIKEALPLTVKRLAVLEQTRRQTTKWGPVLLDVLSSSRSQAAPNDLLIVGHHLRYIEPATAQQALRGVLQNLKSPTPLQNLEVGAQAPHLDLHLKSAQANAPMVETAYYKMLDQVFGRRLFIANRASNATVTAETATSPEFGLGSLLARGERRRRFQKQVEAAANSRDFTTAAPTQWLSMWALANGPIKRTEAGEEVIARLETDGSPLAQSLLSSKSFFRTESEWLIGSDAWAYDLANSGVHHLLASGANVNMLIIDSKPWSESVAADELRRKKDIGLYAMNFGNAYVASVAVYSSYTQVLEAMIEADRFEGPSIILAYMPYNKENDTALTVLQETKKAVDLGYWPLYRWNPIAEESGQPNFNLDSERIKQELEDFLRRDNQLTQLMNKNPRFAASLSESLGTEVRALQKRRAKEAYDVMLESLYGAPLTVLFASDNGNAETLAKRLMNRGRVRGLKTKAFAMDDYPIEDLAGEENVVMITSTAGQGEFPQNGKAFWDAVKENGELELGTVNFTVFALGDSHYWPRKEDRIYYNKPGKDLDARIAFLGAKRLVEIGLGDDQDPDSYHTGYNEWEPKLWQALNVDKVEGLPEEPPPLTNEDIKIQSNYLRGTIEEGLEDPSTGAISASDQQLTKFHGTYMQDDRDLRDDRKAQGLEPAYSFMIRCRLPGGVATAAQWLQMDEISSTLGNHTMKLTTRQTFQFHGVIKTKLKPAMRAINKALMTTIAACGDVNRNVMCSVLPNKSAYHRDVYQVSKKISDHLLPATTAYHEIWLSDLSKDGKKTKIGGDAVVDKEPLYGETYLPRKFKITIAIPPHNDTDVYAHDIGLIAIKGPDERLLGFNVLIGGGMGVTHNNKKTYPRTGSLIGFSPANQTHIVCEKIMLVQRDHGDRKNRKHARLKYTVDNMGVETFKGKVEELLQYKLEAPKEFRFTSNVDTFGWQKDETGANHYTFFIENGRIEDTPDFPMKTGLRALAKIHKGDFRLSPNQHLCMSNVADADLPAVKSTMQQFKLDTPHESFSGLRLSSSACVAFPTCGLAMAESERYLPKLIDKLEACLKENGLERDSIVMRMTGCPNGCARPWLAEVGFVGKAYGAYNMYLGGGYHGNRLNKLYRSSIQEEEILEIMTAMLKRYAAERNEGERFGDWVIRAGYVKPTTEGKTFHDDVAEDESEGE